MPTLKRWDAFVTYIKSLSPLIPIVAKGILHYLLTGKGERELIPNHVLEIYKQGQNKVVETG